MRTFVFCSFKGGTAKTSSALQIASCLAKHHKKRILLIDFDSQANLSAGIGIGPDSLETMVPVLQGNKKLSDVIQKTCVPLLDIVPANVFLDGIETTSPLVSDLYAHERLRKSLISVDYDLCFIDTPPSLGWLTQSAFYAANYSIICAIPEPYSILAMNRLRDYHNELRERHAICCLGVILSFWDDRGAANHAFLDAIQVSFPGAIFETKVRRDISVSRAIMQKRPVIETDPKSRASVDFQNLSLEFLSRLDSIH
jgi:chromosome partitioning protein